MMWLPEIAIRDEVQQVNVWGLFYLWYIDLHTFTHSFAFKKYKQFEIYEMPSLVFHEENDGCDRHRKKLHQLLLVIYMNMYFFCLFESIKTNFIV